MKWSFHVILRGRVATGLKLVCDLSTVNQTKAKKKMGRIKKMGNGRSCETEGGCMCQEFMVSSNS